MKIKSFGKINLNLRVLDEVINGLHKIESLIIPIDLHDVIEIKEIDNDKDIITFDSTDIPDNNTVSKTLDLMRKINDFSQYFEININKNIPSESGLGGGSSNAGTIISKLSQTYDLSIPSNKDVVEKIGSDVPFFITGKPAFVKGVGDIIEPTTIDFEMNMLLVVPKETISTGDAFSEFDRHGNTSTILDIYNGIEIFNDFWDASSTIETKLIKVKDYLETTTGEKFFLSGSGSSMFCLGTPENLQKKIDLIDENQFRIVKVVKKIDFSLKTISD